MRSLSRASSVPRKTSVRDTESAFADFLSDGSSDEDEDDADTRALLRMQQQADDRTYVDTSFKMERPKDSSFRLTLAKPGVDADSEAYMGPRRFASEVESEHKSESSDSESEEEVDDNEVDTCVAVAVSEEGDEARSSSRSTQPRVSGDDESFRSEGRPSFSDAHSFTGMPVDMGPADGSGASSHGSLASGPPSFNSDDGDSFYDAGKPSFSDAHSFTDNSFTTADHSFVYRPSLPDEEDIFRGAVRSSDLTVQDPAGKEVKEEADKGGHQEDTPSFLSRSTTSFIRKSDAATGNLSGIDSSFRLHDEGASEDASFSSVLTDSYSAAAPPELDSKQEQEQPEAQVSVKLTSDPVPTPGSTTPNDSHTADELSAPTLPPSLQESTLLQQNLSVAAVEPSVSSPPGSDGAATPLTAADTSIVTQEIESKSAAPPAELPMPSLSRHSSVSSVVSSSQPRRLTAARESWRVSSLDFRESKHAFDEELGPLAGHQVSPRASRAESDVNAYRLTSTFEERSSVASDASSFTSFHSQANFFVDDLQQGSFSSDRSFSIHSRPSASDSFANVAILGDDARDQNERRSSDVLAQDVNALRGSSIAAAYPVATDALDHSYSDLVDSAVALDRSFSSLVAQTDVERGSVDESATGTSLGSSLASSVASQSSATSEELPFVSFNVVKPTAPEGQAVSPHVAATTPMNPDRERLASESEQVFYGYLVLPRGSDVETIKPSRSASVESSTDASFASPAALLAAIKTRDARTNTRSEEMEAGDIAPGALPPLAPPLKINILPRGRGSLSTISNSAAKSSPSISASPLALSSMTRSSVASSTGTADHLDFTGVYRGSANSLENSRNGAATSTQKSVNQNDRDTTKNKLFESSGVRLERSMSDSRMLQRESQLKVEEFFRRTYRRYDGDVDERLTTRTTRSRTTVIQCVDDLEEEPRPFLRGDKAAKIIDLKNLRSGNKDVAHVQEHAVEKSPSTHSAMGMTAITSSSGTTVTMHSGSDHTSLPPNYLLSPKEAEAQRHQVQDKEKRAAMEATATSGGGFFAVSSGPGGDGVSRFGAVAGRRAENVSLTPSLPRLSAGSPALSPSAFVVSTITPNGFGGSGLGKSPNVFAGTASGFRWKADSGLKRSGVDGAFGGDSRASFTHRPTLADRVQTLSASLASTLHRFLRGRRNQQQNENGVTSPQSQCTAPGVLPRDYDHKGFYQTPFKVPEPTATSSRRNTSRDDPAWIRQWLILATCSILGLSLGAILVRLVVYNATVFNLSADDVRARQESNGALVLAAGVRWLALPGHLFMRLWHAVSIPLLVCYAVTALADLVGCAEKSELVLSFRSLGYALLLAVLASAEGVFAMWLTHKYGWFYQGDLTASSAASTLSNALGVTPLPQGAVGLLCASDDEYLQRLGHDVFACSNASLTLPLFEEVSTNSSGVADSGAAVFALKEVTSLLATPTEPAPYYPASLGSANNVTSSWLSALTPANMASLFASEEDDVMAPLGGLVVFGLLLGYICGTRILWLRRESQAAMFESVRPSDATKEKDPRKPRHYIMSIVMELQLALEWLVAPMERFLAPAGFFSLMLGHVAIHHREWRSFVSPMASLVVGVLIVAVLHAVVVLPIVVAKLAGNRQRNRPSLLLTARTFVPAFLFAFTTDNVALSAPVTMQCYGRALTVTRSAAQLVTAVTAALSRNARGLYVPLMLLWLLESSATTELQLQSSDYVNVALLALLSCFCGGNSRLTLAMAPTLWTLSVGETSSSVLPTTMSLLVVCDAILSRIASVVNVADHLVLAQLCAHHWDETVHLPVSSENDRDGDGNSLLSPIQL